MSKTERKLRETLGRANPVSVSEDGSNRMSILIAQPGQGSMAHYSRAILESQGPATFAPGTHMQIDHQPWDEMYKYPVGSLTKLAAIIDTTPVYREAEGDDEEGLWAECVLMPNWAPLLKAAHQWIGISMNVAAITEAAVIDGIEVETVTEFLGAMSVDFVTHAGAGGKIKELIESAGPKILPPGAKLITNHPKAKPARESAKPKGKSAMAEATEESVQKLIKLQEAAAERDAARLLKEQKEAEEADQIDIGKTIKENSLKLAKSGLPERAMERVSELVEAGVPIDKAIADEVTYLKESIPGWKPGAAGKPVTRTSGDSGGTAQVHVHESEDGEDDLKPTDSKRLLESAHRSGWSLAPVTKKG